MLNRIRHGLLILVPTIALGPFLLAWTTGDKIELKHMYYWDKNKVWSHNPALYIFKSLGEKWSLSFNQEVEAVSGASRRLGLYNIGRQGDNDLKLDGISAASKREFRHSENLGTEYTWDEKRVGISFYFSDERDYTSYAPSFNYAVDLNQKNTTLAVDLSLFYDNMHPEADFAGLGGKKEIKSLTFSGTQLLSPLSLIALTLNSIQSDGYLGHPYTPVILAEGNMVLENVPENKTSFAIAAEYIGGFHFRDKLSSCHINFRYYRDSWELKSYTGDFEFYHYVTDNSYIRLSSRLYSQSSAAFANKFYTGNETYLTSDIRLFKFNSLSLGLKLASAFPRSWIDSGWLPDSWDISYEQGWRDTKGDDNGLTPFSRYQLYPSNEIYAQGIFMLGIGYGF